MDHMEDISSPLQTLVLLCTCNTAMAFMKEKRSAALWTVVTRGTWRGKAQQSVRTVCGGIANNFWFSIKGNKRMKKENSTMGEVGRRQKKDLAIELKRFFHFHSRRQTGSWLTPRGEWWFIPKLISKTELHFKLRYLSTEHQCTGGPLLLPLLPKATSEKKQQTRGGESVCTFLWIIYSSFKILYFFVQ